MPAKKLPTYIIILLASSAYFLFVAMDTLSKYMTQHIEVSQLIWGRYFFHLIAMLVYFTIFRPKLDLKKNFKIQVIRSILMVTATFFMFNSLQRFDFSRHLRPFFYSTVNFSFAFSNIFKR